MSIIEYDIKTKKILVYTPLDRSIISSIKLLNIVNTFMEGLPHIKTNTIILESAHSNKVLKLIPCLVIPSNKYTASILNKIGKLFPWNTVNCCSIEMYFHNHTDSDNYYFGLTHKRGNYNIKINKEYYDKYLLD